MRTADHTRLRRSRFERKKTRGVREKREGEASTAKTRKDMRLASRFAFINRSAAQYGFGFLKTNQHSTKIKFFIQVTSNVHLIQQISGGTHHPPYLGRHRSRARKDVERRPGSSFGNPPTQRYSPIQNRGRRTEQQTIHLSNCAGNIRETTDRLFWFASS